MFALPVCSWKCVVLNAQNMNDSCVVHGGDFFAPHVVLLSGRTGRRREGGRAGGRRANGANELNDRGRKERGNYG